jgi:hypothetical protein
MEKDGSRLFDIQPHQGSVQGFDGSTQSSTSFGKMKIRTSDGTRVLNNVWVVSSLSESLFSIPELVLQLNMLILFSTEGAFEVQNKDGTLLLGRKICNFDVAAKTWTMTEDFICSPESDIAQARIVQDRVGFPPFMLNDKNRSFRQDSFTPEHRAHLMHLRSGCLSRSGMIEVVRRKAIRGYGCTVKEITQCIGKGTSHFCYGCAFCTNKAPMVTRTRGSANSGSTYRNIPDPDNPPGDNAIGTDTMGPLPEDWKGNRWAQIFIHCKHRVVWIVSMKEKHDYFEVLKQFLRRYRRTFPSNSTPELYRSSHVATFEGNMVDPDSFQILRSDRAPELMSAQVDNLTTENLIKQHHTVAHSSFMNGITERAIQTVQKITEALLANAKFVDDERMEMYHRALQHAGGAVYNFLRPHRSLGYTTPFRSWTGIDPHADWFRVFGCTAYVYLEHNERPAGKRSRPYVPGIYVGIEPNTLGNSPTHLIYVPSREKIFVRRSVVFNETMTHDEDRFGRLKNGEIFVDNLQREEVVRSLQNHPIFKDTSPSSSHGADDGTIVGSTDFTSPVLTQSAMGDGTHVTHGTDFGATVRPGSLDFTPSVLTQSAAPRIQVSNTKRKEKSVFDKGITTNSMHNDVPNQYWLRSHDTDIAARRAYPSSMWFLEESALAREFANRVLVTPTPPPQPISPDTAVRLWNTSRRCRKKRNSRITVDCDTLPSESNKGLDYVRKQWAQRAIAENHPKVHAARRVRIATARRVYKKRSKVSNLPTTFSSDVKLSEWDTPLLSWARRRDDWPLWEAAIQKELDQLEARGTWRMLKPGEVPLNRPLGTKLVLKIKRLPDGSIDKYKARLTVQGFLQRYGIDYTKTRSPVTQLATIKMLIAQALRKGRKCKLVDFAGAFLYPLLKEDLYLRAPELLGKGDVILKLVKSLYGLKQASREWFLALRDALVAIGFRQMPQEIDECLFYHPTLDIWIAAYVDDSFVSYSSEESLSSVLDQLKAKKFEFSTVEELNKGLGLQIKRTENSLFISQPNYIQFVMDEFNIPAIKKPTPIVKWFDPRHEDEVPFRPDQKTRFQSLLGALSHLARMTRPEALLAVFHIATFTGDPCQRHYDGLVRIAQHLATDPTRGIHFTKDAPLWEFYCDSDWAGCPSTRRSTEGYVIKFMGGPLIAVSRRQRNVTKSSCEAEYCTFADCAADMVWAKSLADAFQCEFPEPAILRCDNKTAIGMAEGEVALKRTKHIDAFRKHVGVKYHWIRELVDFGIISLSHVPGLENHADILTKPNPRAVFAPASRLLLNETDEFLESLNPVALNKVSMNCSQALAYRSKSYPVATPKTNFVAGDPVHTHGIQRCLLCCVSAA